MTLLKQVKISCSYEILIVYLQALLYAQPHDERTISDTEITPNLYYEPIELRYDVASFG